MLNNEVSKAQDIDQVSKKSDDASAVLWKQFVTLHQDSLKRDAADNQSNNDAMNADKASLVVHSPYGSVTKLIASAKDDLSGDRQAIGNGPHKPGDDQNNIAKERKILEVDNQLLTGGTLTSAQRELVKEDVQSKEKNILNCARDIPNEKKYIEHDLKELKGLQAGHLVPKAAAQVKADRRQDLKLEPHYIDQNNKDAALDKRILQAFK